MTGIFHDEGEYMALASYLRDQLPPSRHVILPDNTDRQGRVFRTIGDNGSKITYTVEMVRDHREFGRGFLAHG